MADQKYPVWMKHPAFQPAVIADANVTGGNIVRGRSVRFPPVMVNTDDEVAYYEAQGYTATDKIDPHMFDPVVGDAPPYAYQEYPSWVANADGKNVLVQNEAQHRAANPGAFSGPPEPAKPVPPAPRSMQAIITEAAALAAGGATLEEIAGFLAKGQPAPAAPGATQPVVSAAVPSRMAGAHEPIDYLPPPVVGTPQGSFTGTQMAEQKREAGEAETQAERGAQQNTLLQTGGTGQL